ncbi:MAG: type I-E CRISPR-associated protein Cse1/CasA [Symbiobacteriia bacterium]
MASFNLLTEPWIPARAADGTVQEYGLLDLLANAHTLIGVVDPAPPIQFGLYRILIAFLIDALAIRELDDLEDRLLQEGPLDPAELNRYVERVGRDRFDLFGADHPFLQTPPDPEDETRLKSVAELFFHLPTGTNVTHFYHVLADQHALAPAVCARGLCAVAPFMTAGGAGYSPSVNGTPPWYVLARGNNLLHTLMLNCYPEDDLDLPGTSGPVWMSDKPLVPRQESACGSLSEGLTWRPRQVRLLPGEGGVCTYTGCESPVLVRQMVWGPGFRFSGSGTWTDPQVAYSESDKGRFPLRPREGRELWRDTGPLLLLRKEDYESERGRVRFSRPLVVEQFRRLKSDRVLPPEQPERVDIYGVRADKAKVFEWQYERLSLPTGVLENPRAGVQVQSALDLADSVAYALRSALKQIYPRGGEGNPDAMERTIERARTGFWSVLRSRFEGEFLPLLGVQEPGDIQAESALGEAWKGAVRSEGWRSLDEAIGPFDTGADGLRRQVAARRQFGFTLAKLLAPAGDGGKSKMGRRGVKA